MNILTLRQAIRLERSVISRHLILGNGFSISCDSRTFSYDNLRHVSALSNRYPELDWVFRGLDTHDFEQAMNALETSARFVDGYFPGTNSLVSKKMREHSHVLKDTLATVIADIHPQGLGPAHRELCSTCADFLNYFHSYFSLNYDFLLYWATMEGLKSIEGFSCNDGFSNVSVSKGDYLVWQPQFSATPPNLHYLHGSLHIFDTGLEVQKRRHTPDSNLRQSTIDSIQSGHFPLLVTEGTANQKRSRIMHNAYLHNSYQALSRASGTLYMFGASLADNDDHILQAIVENKALKRLAIGVFGPEPSELARIEHKVSSKFGSKQALYFFDTSKVDVWRNRIF